MPQSTRTWRLLALVGASSLALAGCGGGGSTGTSAPATSSSSAPAGTSSGSAAPTSGDGVLTIGSLLPQTGDLAYLGPPEFAGVRLAVKEVNAAGGVLGKEVKYVEGDSGDTKQDIANPTVDRLLQAKADAIIGAASSGVSKTVIDKITRAGVVHYSPANTDPSFTTYDDRGLYFRTAPSDVLQGRVLGETVLGDGHSNVAILVRQDPYGEGLAKNVADTVKANGGTLTPSAPVFYDPAASNFDAQIGQLKTAKPDAIVLIGFEESSKIIQGFIAQGIGPQDVALYLTDGNLSNKLGDGLPSGALKGVKGTLPGAAAPGDFRKRLLSVDPKLDDYAYSAESYDAVVTVALAAVVAKSDAGQEIAKQLPAVTRGGEKCTSVAECMKLAQAGQDLDYDGVSGPIELSQAGDPTQASIGIYTYGANNKFDAADAEFVTGKLEG